MPLEEPKLFHESQEIPSKIHASNSHLLGLSKQDHGIHDSTNNQAINILQMSGMSPLSPEDKTSKFNFGQESTLTDS